MSLGKILFAAWLLILFGGCSSPLDSHLPDDRKRVDIYLVGDSTVAEGGAQVYPMTGWGQVIQQYLDPLINIVNKAASGRSTKSYLNSGKWQAVLDTLKENDLVFIEFGHNDEKKENPDVGVSLEDYQRNLVKYVTDARSKKAIPVLLTPIARRNFANGAYVETHGGYPDAMRAVSMDCGVPLIDMHAKSVRFLKVSGPDSSKVYYNWLKAGEYPNYPNGSKDNTHFSEIGAMKMAKLVVEGMLESNLVPKEYVLLIH